MHIAFIVNYFPTISESFILNQITGLLDLGHTVEIFAKENPKESKCHEDIYKYKLLEKVHYFESIPVGFLENIIKTFLLIIKYRKKDPIVLLKSIYCFKKYKYSNLIGRYYFALPFLGKQFDIVQCHFGPNGNIGAFLKQSGCKFKLVTMFHGYDIRLLEKMGTEIYNLLKKYGDGFLAISSYNYKNMVDIGLDVKKIYYHSVGIDLKKYPYRAKSVKYSGNNTIKIISVARLVEEKGLDYAIHAISKLVEEYPGYNFEYRIIGDGPLRNSLKKLISDLGLWKCIKILGIMDQENVIRNLKDADIFFLSSVAEALPVVLMEAQAIGLPVVTTDVGSISEIVLDNKTGFIVPIKDIDAMKNKIAYLMQHSEIWPEMGRAGRANVGLKYDMNVLNKNLETIYQELIGAIN